MTVPRGGDPSLTRQALERDYFRQVAKSPRCADVWSINQDVVSEAKCSRDAAARCTCRDDSGQAYAGLARLASWLGANAAGAYDISCNVTFRADQVNVIIF